MLFVGGDEDQLRGRGEASQDPTQGHPVQARHRDVAEDDVDLVGLEHLERLGAVRRREDRRDSRIGVEQEPHLGEGGELVIDDEGPQGAVIGHGPRIVVAVAQEPVTEGPLMAEPGPDLNYLAHVVPSARQLAWQELEFYGFLHFGMNTMTDREWGDGTESPSLFAPEAVDADAWVALCVEAGMSAVILTCKHHDGFALWPTRHSYALVCDRARGAMAPGTSCVRWREACARARPQVRDLPLALGPRREDVWRGGGIRRLLCGPADRTADGLRADLLRVARWGQW